MALLGYQKRFAEEVMTGVKRNTIRMKRKHPIKPGETLYHYTGLRTKHSYKLLESKCLFVFEVTIENSDVLFDKSNITDTEVMEHANNFLADLYCTALLIGKPKTKKAALRICLDAFAQNDGFEDFDCMKQWFNKTHGLPFTGDFIRW